MLTYDYRKRITANECLSHSFFSDIPMSLKQVSSGKRPLLKNSMQYSAASLMN